MKNQTKKAVAAVTTAAVTVAAVTTVTLGTRLKYDVNGDRKINRTDQQIIVDYINGKTVLDEDSLKAADFDNDGAVDGFDAVMLDLYLNNLY